MPLAVERWDDAEEKGPNSRPPSPIPNPRATSEETMNVFKTLDKFTLMQGAGRRSASFALSPPSQDSIDLKLATRFVYLREASAEPSPMTQVTSLEVLPSIEKSPVTADEQEDGHIETIEKSYTIDYSKGSTPDIVRDKWEARETIGMNDEEGTPRKVTLEDARRKYEVVATAEAKKLTSISSRGSGKMAYEAVPEEDDAIFMSDSDIVRVPFVGIPRQSWADSLSGGASEWSPPTAEARANNEIEETETERIPAVKIPSNSIFNNPNPFSPLPQGHILPPPTRHPSISRQSSSRQSVSHLSILDVVDGRKPSSEEVDGLPTGCCNLGGFGSNLPNQDPQLPLRQNVSATRKALDPVEIRDGPCNPSTEDMVINETPALSREPSYTPVNDAPVPIAARTQSIAVVRQSQVVHPPSRYDGYPRPLPVTRERHALDDFIELLGDKCNAELDGNEFKEVLLEDFLVYLPASSNDHPYEMVGMQNLFQNGHSQYVLDGVLSVGGERRYVEGAHFNTVSVGGYGGDHEEVTGIWIQTMTGAKWEVYYRLGRPHRHYARFLEGFMWVANLSKYFVEYALETAEQGQEVSIYNFRKDFHQWLEREYGEKPSFKRWHAEFKHGTDFRTAVANNIDWLYKEAIGTFKLTELEVWAEIWNHTKLKFHKPREEKTIVTSYVYECFKEMAFGRFLKKVAPIGEIDFRRKSIGTSLHLSVDAKVLETDKAVGMDYEATATQLAKSSLEGFKRRPFDKSTIAVGDVLGVLTDDARVSQWKSEKTRWADVDDCWFVYVQAIETNKKGEHKLNVLWLYKPADTSCALMKYPYPNELFMSAHCECGRKEWTKLEDVICRVSVAWGGNPGCKEDFFVRQTFRISEIAFTTFTESDKSCEHRGFELSPFERALAKYQVGDTVLVQLKQPRDPDGPHKWQRLEPYDIISFDADDDSVSLRRLLRRQEVQPESEAKPNELLYTNQIITLPANRIHHQCRVRFYSGEQIRANQVPNPYDRNGTGDFFYISTEMIDTIVGRRFEDIDPDHPPASFLQGFDPTAAPPKNPMRGLDLFCGGGNLGRGLEDGGGIRFTHACDLNENALASYYANIEHPEPTKFYSGSVDDLLKHAMDGNPKNLPGVPLPGDIEFIAAGSPCQGFSMMNTAKDKHDAGLKNQSLVADVAAMIEFYRPKYAVLENVTSISTKAGPRRFDDCLSQLICCVVGLGYQVQVQLLDSWSFGCPQSRTRIFVVIAGPDLVMPEHPYLSHSHHDEKMKSVGLMANKLSIAERKYADTAFKWVCAEDATADLPDIGDGQTYHCTAFPDHRMSTNIKENFRAQMACIPLYPPQMNYQKAYPNMTKDQRALFAVKDRESQLSKIPKRDGNNGYARVGARKLFPTITTKCAPKEKFNGRVIHWEQQRTITIMEAKRAQGFLDTDVLTGTKGDQYKIVGNSVARPVATAAGIAFREAWLKNEDDNPPLDAPLVPISTIDPKRMWASPSPTSSGNSETDSELAKSRLKSSSDDSSWDVTLPLRRPSQFAAFVPARNSIVTFGAPSSFKVIEASRKQKSMPTIQTDLRRERRESSPLSAIPTAMINAWPGLTRSETADEQSDTDSDSDMPDSVERNVLQAIKNSAPKTRKANLAPKPGTMADLKAARNRDTSRGRTVTRDSSHAMSSGSGAKVKRTADVSLFRRVMSPQGRGRSQQASRALSEAVTDVDSAENSDADSRRGMSRADLSIAQACAKFSFKGRRRNQHASGAEGELEDNADNTGSNTPSGMSRADFSIAQAVERFAKLDRRRSQFNGQHVSEFATPEASRQPSPKRPLTAFCFPEEPPRTAKRRRLPSKPKIQGSAGKPIALDDSDDDISAIFNPIVSSGTPMHETPPGSRTGLLSANSLSSGPRASPHASIIPTDQPLRLAVSRVGRPAEHLRKKVHKQKAATAHNSRVQFPAPVQSPSHLRSHSFRPPKQKMTRAPTQFVIDLTADSDDEDQAKRRPMQRYQPVDNSRFMGYMLTNNRLELGGNLPMGGMGLGTDMSAAIESVRMAESGTRPMNGGIRGGMRQVGGPVVAPVMAAVAPARPEYTY